MYKIETEKFSGPLDLLLQLIEEKQLEITEISLAEVTDQFLEYISQLGEKDAEELAAAEAEVQQLDAQNRVDIEVVADDTDDSEE